MPKREETMKETMRPKDDANPNAKVLSRTKAIVKVGLRRMGGKSSQDEKSPGGFSPDLTGAGIKESYTEDPPKSPHGGDMHCDSPSDRKARVEISEVELSPGQPQPHGERESRPHGTNQSRSGVEGDTNRQLSGREVTNPNSESRPQGADQPRSNVPSDTHWHLLRKEVASPYSDRNIYHGLQESAIQTSINATHISPNQNENNGGCESNQLRPLPSKINSQQRRLEGAERGPTIAREPPPLLLAPQEGLKVLESSEDLKMLKSPEYHLSNYGEGSQIIDSSFTPGSAEGIGRVNTADQTTENTSDTGYEDFMARYIAENKKLKNSLKRAVQDKNTAQTQQQKTNNSYVAALQKNDQDVQRAKTEERERLQIVFDRELVLAKSGATRFQEDVKRKDTEIKALEKELTKAQDDFNTLQRRKDSSDAELKEARSLIEGLQEGEHEMIDTIDRLRGNLGPDLGREHFKGSYTELRNKIQYWSEDFFKGECRTRSSASSALRNLSGDYNDYLSSPDMRVKLVQSFVWSELNKEIFASLERNSPGLWWAHSHRNELSGLRAFLMPSESQDRAQTEGAEIAIRDYHRWRATTAQLISSNNESQKLRLPPEKPIDKILDCLGPFKSDKGLQRTNNECFAGLETIFTLAIKLDQEMNEEFAFYHLAIPYLDNRPNIQYGFQFDEQKMKVDPTMIRSDGRMHYDVVGLVVTPILLVLGDRNGAGFLEAPEVLEQSVVIPQGALSRKSRRDIDPEPRESRKRVDSQKLKKSNWYS